MPWVEVPREEERFRDVLFLECVYHLLHLKPLVDTDLDPPAIYIFPSWEKSLEAQDPDTRDQIDRLTAAVFSNELGYEFYTSEEIRDYASAHKDDFFAGIEERQLFVAPGGVPGDKLETSLRQYVEEINRWRSSEYRTQVLRLPDEQLVLLAIQERLAPQYHLLENADELGAHPLTSLQAHWHYYRKCSSFFSARLLSQELLSPKTVTEIDVLSRGDFSWLSNVSIGNLVTLRENRENEVFRRRLREFTQNLHDSALQDLDKVATDVSRGLRSMIADHQKELEKIIRKYDIKAVQAGIAVVVAGAVTMVPSLAPLIGGTALLAPIGKISWDAVAEIMEKRTAARSLMGILSAARQN